PEGSNAMTLDIMPPVGSIALGVSSPVCESTAKVESVFVTWLATIANRCAGGGCGGGAVLTPPQALKSTGSMRTITERAVSLADMPFPLVGLRRANHPVTLRVNRELG